MNVALTHSFFMYYNYKKNPIAFKPSHPILFVLCTEKHEGIWEHNKAK